MPNYSLTYAGALAMLLGSALRYFGVSYDEAPLKEVVSALLVVAGFAHVLYGRFRVGGVKWHGGKK